MNIDIKIEEIEMLYMNEKNYERKKDYLKVLLGLITIKIKRKEGLI